MTHRQRPMVTTPVNVRLARLILILLILLAFGRGVWALGGKSLWWDESLSLHRATGTVGYILSDRIVLTDNTKSVETIDNHPPLYFLLLWAAVRLAGQSEFALRFLSLVAVVLIVPLLYVTGRRLVDEGVGLAAAALGAVSPMYLWYGQEARMYALLTFFSLLSFYAFVRAFLDPARPPTGRQRWSWIVTYVLASVCVIFSHHLGSILIACELLVLVLLFLRRARSRSVLAITVAVVSLVLLLSLAYAFLHLSRVINPAGFHFVSAFVLARDLLNSFSLGLSVDVGDWYVLLIDLVFLLFLILGFVRLVQPGVASDRRRAGWLLAGFLLIPVLLVYLISYVQPVYMNSRHLIFVTPAFYLLVAAGLTGLRGRWVTIALLGGLLMAGGIGYSIWNYYGDPAYDKDQHREWGAYLREQVRPGDVVVVDPPHIAELYEYYAASDVPWVGLPLLDSASARTVAVLEDLLTRYDRVWLALSYTPPWGDRRRLPQTWLDENAFRVDLQGFHSYASNVLVAAYLPGWPSVGRLPADAQPLEVRYTPALQLMGYRLVSPAEPGKPLHVQLFWAVDQTGPDQVGVLLRLVDGEGHLVGQGEECPFNGLYPMWQWQSGLLLSDEHELPIWPGTPPGTYQVELVLVSRPDGCAGGSGEPILPLGAPLQAQRGERVLLGAVSVGRAETSPSQAELNIGQRHRARFDGLVLLGSDLAPAELKPGDPLDVTLYWEAKRDALPDARLRVRLVDSAGEIRQEAIIRPAGDAYPTDQWLAGDRFRGQFRLLLPEGTPAGRYQLELVPESPLQPTGVWATLRRWFGATDIGLRLGWVQVVEARPGLPAAQATPIPLPVDLAITQPMVLTLGDQVRFLGYDLDSDAVRAGEALSLTLYWEALSTMDTSYTVFTHLLGPSNQVVGQKDNVPLNGTYPTALWEPGQVIADPYRIVVAADTPPGDYPLEVGMYRPDTSKRLPVIEADGQPLADDRILLSNITVLPALTAAAPPAPKTPIRFYLPLVMSDR